MKIQVGDLIEIPHSSGPSTIGYIWRAFSGKNNKDYIKINWVGAHQKAWTRSRFLLKGVHKAIDEGQWIHIPIANKFSKIL